MPCRNGVMFIVLFVVWASLPVLIMGRHQLNCPSPKWGNQQLGSDAGGGEAGAGDCGSWGPRFC